MSHEGPGEREIRPLDETTVRRIAAGEVVERPASVVKELVENAIDADAGRVSVAVDGDGTERVRVRDDGVGMSPSGLELAVREHTTSKIRDIDDLTSGVGTLGFRGEALYTIGAVSRLTVRSRPRGSEGAGAEITVEGGDVGEVRPVGCPEGTTVEVEELFFNTPAREKFLGTEATEFDHVSRVLTGYALANPGVAVSLAHDGREVFATDGDGDLRSAVLSVYGREVAESMIELEWPVAGTDADAAVDAVEGLVSHPETTRSSREYLSTFVNGRYVTAGALREAVLEAYGGQLAADRYPFAVLFVEVPPGEVDVNVHPRKTEVRFDREPGVRAAVREAVEAALLDHGLVRSSAPRGRSAPEETEIDPGNADDPGTVDAARSGDGSEPRPGSTPPGTDSEAAPDTARSADAGAGADVEAEDGPDGSEPRGSRPSPRTSEEIATGGAAADPGSVQPESPPGGGLAPEYDADGTGAGTEHAPGDGGAGGVDAPTSQRTLGGAEATVDRAFESLPRLRVLGQLHDTYLVAETDDGMVLIDQHAADERVTYERLRERVGRGADAQALAEPVELELTAREAALFEEGRESLASVGFRAERTGERTVEVRSVPAVLEAALDPELLRDVLAGFVDDGDREAPVEAAADSLLADLACYPSITGNTSLTEGSVSELLAALDGCENPYACPHGRPVVVSIEDAEIEERFERDYPGHGDRRE